MKRQPALKRLQHDARRTRWSTPKITFKSFALTLMFITAMALLLFGFSTLIVELFKAIGI